MNGDYFEQDIKPPVRKRLAQIVLAALVITSVASLVAVKVMSDQRQQALEKADVAIQAQQTAEVRANVRQPPTVVSPPTNDFTATVTAVTAQSRSRELAYAALAQQDVDPERGILLAVEANRITHTPEAEDALRRSLSASHLRLKLSTSESIPIRSAQYSPDGLHVLTRAAGGSAQVWSLNDGRIQYMLRGHDGDIVDAEYSPDGKHILTLGMDKMVRVWSADTGALLFGLLTDGGVPMMGHFSPVDQRFAMAERDGTVQIIQIISPTAGAPLVSIHVPNSVTLAWSPDGQSVLTVGLDQPAIRVWDSRDGNLRLQVDEAASIVTFSPDSRYIAVAAAVEVQVWGIGSGQTECTMDRTSTGLQFSPMGDQLLISDWYAGQVTLWDLWNVKKCTLNLTGPSGYSAGLLSPDGGYLALQRAGDPGTVTLWSYEKFGRKLQPMATLRAGDGVNAMQFSPDSRSLLTLGHDAVRVWSVASGPLPDSVDDLVALAQTRVTRQLTCAEQKAYLHEGGPCDAHQLP